MNCNFYSAINGVCLILLLTTGEISLHAQELYFPPTIDTSWQRVSLSEAGYCEQGIDALDDFLAASNTKAFMLLKDGEIVHERYFGSFTKDSLWVWNSAGKALTATLIGIAQDKGLLSIEDKTNRYLGDGWTSLTPSQEDNILLSHQLSMTTGLDDAVSDPFCTEPACLIYEAEPGERWAYHNGPYTRLIDVLEEATGQQVNAFVRQELRASTGMQGIYVDAGYNRLFVSKPRTLARFGLLMLAGGSWDGQEVLSDQGYVQAMLNPSQALNEAYGYLWWLNGKSSFMLPQSQSVFAGELLPNASEDALIALGKDGQILLIDPSRNEIWIRMGERPSLADGFVPNLYTNEIADKIALARCGSSSTQAVELTPSLILNNPVGHQLMLSPSVDLVSLEVYNFLGQRCFGPASFVDSVLDVSAYQAGNYLLVGKMKNGKRVIATWVKY